MTYPTRFMVVVERRAATTSPAMNVTRDCAWETARRVRSEDSSAKVSIIELVDDGEPRCVLDWDEPL